ncbi:MAG TPA: hypothetical protein VK990_07990, partial [Acidimicrobiia bacterium]|nr:hypothetical protein [Acidimicrobiia bacterium]
MRRTLLIAALLSILVACSGSGEPVEEPGIDVIDVSGPLDASALEFMKESIEGAATRGQELAVLQINSRAVLDRRAFTDLIETLESPPLPLAVWVGPAPAVAGGGAAHVALRAEHAAISPGSSFGPGTPIIVAESGEEALGGAIPAEETGLDLQPTLRQYLQDLNGETFQTADGPVTVETLVPFGDGVTLKTPTFRQPGLGVRFFRLAATPEAAFFFLVVGLAIASFEFFAIGPGVAAGVAGLSLMLAGWGMVNLPVRPWAVGVAVMGWALLTAAYQRGGVLALTLLGAVMLQVGGTFLVDGGGDID